MNELLFDRDGEMSGYSEDVRTSVERGMEEEARRQEERQKRTPRRPSSPRFYPQFQSHFTSIPRARRLLETTHVNQTHRREMLIS